MYLLYTDNVKRTTTTKQIQLIFQSSFLRDDDHIASDLFNIHENDREIKPDVYVSKTPRVEGFPKSFKKIGRTIPGPNRLLLTNIYYLFCKRKHWYSINLTLYSNKW